MTTRRALLIASPMLLAIVVLVGSELLLPGMAEDRLRTDLGKSGTVQNVQVSATPALKLLFGKADRVTVRMAEVRAAGTRTLADLLEDTRPAERVDATVGAATVGPLRLRDITLRKRDGQLEGVATVTEDDLAALPANVQVKPVEATPEGGLVFEVTAGLFGVQASARANLSVVAGDLIVKPEADIPLLGDIATLSIFSDNRVIVESVGATEREGGFTMSAKARLAPER